MRGQGFDGIQLGPQGQTAFDNKSPYDARIDGRDFLSLDLPVTGGGPTDGRVHHREAWKAMKRALHGVSDEEIQRRLDEQHRRLRAECGLRLYGDLQIGMAPEDVEAHRELFLPGWRLGAPPSRTNPEGQPWGYPVFDPRQREAVLGFVRARARRLGADFDAIRIDHPHGLVCPWVYREGTPVASGARLHESPDIPELAPFSIARPEQIDHDVPRHADRRVTWLDDDQVTRYSHLIDAIVEEAHGEVVCEVLSTLPYPLARVMERHQLGRFRVAQKLSLTRPDDVYRIEKAEPGDWIMAGNHDTPPIWRLVEEWRRGPTWADWAHYLGGLLGGDDTFVARLLAQPVEMIHALFAAMMKSRAGNLLIFFPDLLGITDIHNVPGTINEENWTLRVPPDYAARPPALDLGRARAMARGLLTPWP